MVSVVKRWDAWRRRWGWGLAGRPKGGQTRRQGRFSSLPDVCGCFISWRSLVGTPPPFSVSAAALCSMPGSWSTSRLIASLLLGRHRRRSAAAFAPWSCPASSSVTTTSSSAKCCAGTSESHVSLKLACVCFRARFTLPSFYFVYKRLYNTLYVRPHLFSSFRIPMALLLRFPSLSFPIICIQRDKTHSFAFLFTPFFVTSLYQHKLATDTLDLNKSHLRSPYPPPCFLGFHKLHQKPLS